MKKVTLAVILLVSLSFTAVQTNEYYTETYLHDNEQPYAKIDTVKNTVVSDTLISYEAISEEKENVKEAIELSKKALVSWYGGKFHGRLTSSGERYNMNDLTAAHKSLPFGTKVKIRNPKNGKEVIVRITDRGPFIPKREFDLSKAAFAELANLNSGVLNITYEIL